MAGENTTMEMMSVAEARSLRLIQLAAIVLIGVKLVHMALAGPFMDETYYWMWGQHLALSYYDHPPLNAWILWVSESVFGWNRVALRAPVFLTFAADLVALGLISRTLAGEAWRRHFAVTTLLFITTPVYWLVSSLALPDHVMMCGALFAMAFFLRFFADRDEGAEGRTRDLIAGALMLGMAILAKYNAAFIGIGLALYVLVRDRDLLKEPRLYLAGALVLAMQAPVIIWNLTEGFASWQFILQGRHSGVSASGQGLVLFAVLALVTLSPFLLWPILRFALPRRDSVPGEGFARAVFAVSSVAIIGVASVTQVLFHWNLIAYVAMLPFLALVMRPRWLLIGQVVYGALFAGLALVNYGVQPLLDTHAYRDQASAWSFDWNIPADAVRRAQQLHDVGFVATADYTTASLLGFTLQDRDVVSIDPKREAYDFWFDPAAHQGQNAILLGDDYKPIGPAIRAQFADVDLLETVEVRRGGQLIDSYRVYIGRGFRTGTAK